MGKIKVLSSNIEGSRVTFDNVSFSNFQEVLDIIAAKYSTFRDTNWKQWSLRGSYIDGGEVKKFAINPGSTGDTIAMQAGDTLFHVTDSVPSTEIKLGISPLKMEGGVITEEDKASILALAKEKYAPKEVVPVKPEPAKPRNIYVPQNTGLEQMVNLIEQAIEHVESGDTDYEEESNDFPITRADIDSFLD